MNIYEILSSLSHNDRYLLSYIKFINRCQRYKLTTGEMHHVCPKADGLFPQFNNLKDNPWNGILLTKKQHIIAHMFLAKIYNHQGMKYAVHMMLSETREINQSNVKYLHIKNKYRECPWCNKSVKGGNFFKHHGDNCKLSPNYVSKNKQCPHCGIICDPINYERSHGDNCKLVAGTKKINYNRSPETKAKQRAGRLGRKMKEETKIKLQGVKPMKICDIITKREFSIVGWSVFLRHDKNRNKLPNLQKDLESLF
jgi:hypothetical protein